jgi:hypothetical protein
MFHLIQSSNFLSVLNMNNKLILSEEMSYVEQRHKAFFF